MLNPVFSPKHMRGLVPIFYPIAHQLRDILAKKVTEGEEEIDMSSWMSRAALEYIGQGGMGYRFDSLDLSSTNKYHDAVKLFVCAVSTYSLIGGLIRLIPAQFCSSSTSSSSSSHTLPAWEALGSVERSFKPCLRRPSNKPWILSTSCTINPWKYIMRRRTLWPKVTMQLCSRSERGRTS